MAKWGKGDPRWLVEDRPDATNVNNWHWTEKNASQWSKNKFTEFLIGLKIDDDVAECEITEMSKCEGDAAVNNRKAKLIFFYEWTIELKWKGRLKEEDGFPATGTLEILNLSEEHEIKDVDVIVTLDKPKSEYECIKVLMRKMGTAVVKQKLSSYLQALREEFSKGVILPTKDSAISSVRRNEQGSYAQSNLIEGRPVNSIGKSQVVETCEYKSTENFKCTAEEFYKALTIKEMVQAFTQGDCIVDAVKNGKFEFYSGNVYGHFTELIPHSLIKQKWRFRSWPDGIFSDVTIKITEKSDSVEVSVHQKGIPKTELDNTSEGWKRYYWESMKRVFGFGAVLF